MNDNIISGYRSLPNTYPKRRFSIVHLNNININNNTHNNNNYHIHPRYNNSTSSYHRRRATEWIKQKANVPQEYYNYNSNNSCDVVNNNRISASLYEYNTLQSHYKPLISNKIEKLNNLQMRLKKLEMKLSAITAFKLKQLMDNNNNDGNYSNNYENNSIDRCISINGYFTSSKVKHYRLILQRSICRQYATTQLLLKQIKYAHKSILLLCHKIVQDNLLNNPSNPLNNNNNNNGNMSDMNNNCSELYNIICNYIESWDTESKHLRRFPFLHIDKLIHNIQHSCNNIRNIVDSQLLKLQIANKTCDYAFKLNSLLVKTKQNQQLYAHHINHKYKQTLQLFNERQEKLNQLKCIYYDKEIQLNNIIENEQILMQQITNRHIKQINNHIQSQ